MQIEEEERQKKIEFQISERKRREEVIKNSRHIQQLNHMADICEDYNFIVDQLEDEHQRRTVHTT